MSTEFDFIAWIAQQQKPSPMVRVGIGDDLAVLNWDRQDLLLVGVDQVLDGVHFDSAIHSPMAIGAKAVNRNLSDCAAMGCLPAAAVVTVALPKGVGQDYAKQLHQGMQQAGEIFDCPIVGGDTASWPGKLVVTVTILGKSEGISPITRTGAKAGDLIYVTGPLGGSILGRHMTFKPRVETGRTLAMLNLASAMIDLSDGLSRDLAHICKASSVGADIDAARLPIHTDVARLPANNLSPTQHALHDGEDYELLFTTPHSLDEKAGNETFFRIGRITDQPGIRLIHADGKQEDLVAASWQHTF